jgi:hypothetical protein
MFENVARSLAPQDAKVVMLFSDGDPNRAENSTAFSNRMLAFREAMQARAAAVCLYAVQVEDELNVADPNQLSQQRLLQCDIISVRLLPSVHLPFGCQVCKMPVGTRHNITVSTFARVGSPNLSTFLP